jgi:hypothetical protein
MAGRNRPTRPGTTPVTQGPGGGNSRKNNRKNNRNPAAPHLNLPAPGVLGHANMTPKGWGNTGPKKRKAVQQNYQDFLRGQAAANAPAAADPAAAAAAQAALDNQKALDRAKAQNQTQQENLIKNAHGLITGQRNDLGAGFYQGGATDFDRWQEESGYLDKITEAALTAFNYNQLYANPATSAPTQAGVTPLNLPKGQFDQTAARREYLNSQQAPQAGSQFFNPSGRWSWWD